MVFAFEGVDDKTVYYHWIKSLSPELTYEFFVCKGKERFYFDECATCSSSLIETSMVCEAQSRAQIFL